MASVSLRGIRKVYEKNVVAVDDFNLEIADKEFIALVGPSGCGKSTTLRMIAGLEGISEGELFIGGRKMNGVEPKDRDIAMVFQSYALYPHMSVYDNMAFAMKMRKVPRDEIRRKVEEAAKILEIQDLLHRKPKALSGGQRQRVAIGRAIVRNPKVFLMDEPLSNLDAKLRNQMRAEIIMLRKRIDTTFMYVTHDQTEAMTLGDRLVIMDKGLIQQIGTPQEVFNAPANTFVAGFIGVPQMNFLDAALRLEGGVYYAEALGRKVALDDETQSALKAGRAGDGMPTTLGIRPEHVELASEGDGGAVAARLQVSEMLGSEIYLHVAISGKTVVIRTPVTPALGNLGVSGGDVPLWFRLPKEKIHLFGHEDGRNLVKPYVAEHLAAQALEA